MSGFKEKWCRYGDKLSRSALLTFLIALSLPVSPWAGTYYVSPAGLATWQQCTGRDHPCPAAAAMANARAGDTVIFLDGVYQVGSAPWYTRAALRPANSGTPGSPITFKAENPLKAVVKGDNRDNSYTNVIGTEGKEHIVWDGFKVQAADYQTNAPLPASVTIYGSKHIILRNSEIIGATQSCGYNCLVNGIRIQSSQYVLIQNNLIHGYHFSEQPAPNTGAMMVYFSNYLTVERNTVYDCDRGLYYKVPSREPNPPGNIVFRYNFVFDVFEPGLYMNSIAYTSDSQGDLVNAKVYQNIVANTDSAGFAQGSDGSEAKNLEVYNNVFYNTGSGISYSNGNNTQFWNNIIVANGIALGSSGTKGYPTYSDYNCYYRGQTFWTATWAPNMAMYHSLRDWQASGKLLGGGNPDLNSKYADPLFINAGTTDVKDYKLQTGSPCLGIDRQDYDGDGNMAERIPMGAYIIGNEVIGYSPAGVSNPSAYCGDNSCNGKETCSTCPYDCGSCPDITPPSNPIHLRLRTTSSP